MAYEEVLEKLNGNPKEESAEAVRLLIKIADNIIKEPNNTKIRTLQKSNATISKKVLNVSGAITCLKLMGFQEHDTCFLLPAEASLKNVLNGKDTLLMWKESIEHSSLATVASKANAAGASSSENSSSECQNSAFNRTVIPTKIIKPISLPALNSFYSDPFLHKIEVQFHNSLRYANKDVQERARQLIPVVTLENSAQERLRAIQIHVKKAKLREPYISIQDMLILELLQWFKEDFFSWVDSPDCESCQSKTRFSHIATDKSLFVYTSRVELHKCENCHRFTPFARYEDLNILLETRRGRCGEWANVFTLFCRAMGWDARFVLDENDHVWTEVYSIAQGRWLHCDPCEIICDKPLIYESGWKKKMTYVIAYSNEEVQDVTWRYSSNHQEVLKRRKLCDENKLMKALRELREKRQISFSNPRKVYLTKRLVLELADMLTERKPGDEENKGRQSGEEIWRLARGEAHEEEISSEFVWRINLTDLVDNKASLRYSAANDVYKFLTGGAVNVVRQKWAASCFHHSNIIRKEERDWKQVYLARKEGDREGNISWKFQFEGDLQKRLDTISVQFYHTTFENGVVIAKICSDDLCEVIAGDTKSLQTNRFAGKTSLTIEAILKGGKGDVAWQHTQLFRQPLDSDDFPFIINFSFK